MNVLYNDNSIYVDVDETLVHWKGTTYTPMQKNINSLVRHYHRGHHVVVWSQGGAAWAEKVVRELGLEKYVDEVRSKPKWIIDDKDPNEWMERYWYSDDGKTKVNVILGGNVLGETETGSAVHSSPYPSPCSLYPEITNTGKGLTGNGTKPIG